ncbi:hypothetical protein N9H34_00790 [bacterium]|nr:hypothetical protein [bacterium]
MDNFNLQGYMASGKLHANSETLTEAKKQGYDDREDESLGARKGAEKDKKQSMKARRDDSYGKFGKRDAEKKGKNKINKEGKMLKEGYTNREVFQAISDIADAITNLRKLGNEAYGGEKKNVYSSGAGDAFKAFDKAFADLDNNLQMVDVKLSEGAVTEDARTDAEQEGYKDGFDDAKDDVKDALSKMKVSELKAKIKETIIAELSLSEAEEEVDVDIDVEDEVEVEAGADDIEIERPGVKTTVDVGLSPEEEVVQDSLKAAMDAANELGNQKLADQIGNTITFFTREFVVGQNTD